MRPVPTLILSALLLLPLAAGPVPCEVAARQDPAPKPEPMADVTPPQLRIGGELKVLPYRIVRLDAQGLPDKAGRIWKVKPLDDAAASVDWATGRNVLKPQWVAPPGRYAVTLTVAWTDKDGQLQLNEAEAVVTVGDPAPTPTPPGPNPPKPPAPQPPQPATALRVIVVRESGQAAPSWLSSPKVRDYLDRHCVKGPGGLPEWRVFDPQQVLTGRESPTIKALWEATKPSLGAPPQVAVSRSPSDGKLYPLPKTEAEALAFFKQFGGE